MIKSLLFKQPHLRYLLHQTLRAAYKNTGSEQPPGPQGHHAEGLQGHHWLLAPLLRAKPACQSRGRKSDRSVYSESITTCLHASPGDCFAYSRHLIHVVLVVVQSISCV